MVQSTSVADDANAGDMPPELDFDDDEEDEAEKGPVLEMEDSIEDGGNVHRANGYEANDLEFDEQEFMNYVIKLVI